MAALPPTVIGRDFPHAGALEHRDPAGTRDQLLCVHRGHAQRFVTAAGEVLTEEDPAGLHELDDPGSTAD
ncbi:hypothetical protein [Streptomyces sp. NPDC048527]|uniref:hypothetical protein n=1 Tax=Streptomyces sp. NPDC048527 TaxID=3365568 RepID=UPI00371668C9